MAKKHDPFFVHLWHELTSAKLLQESTYKKWIDVPTKLQSEFITAARKAMQAALGVPSKPKRKAAKKTPPAKAKKTAKPKSKPQAKPKSKIKAKTKRARGGAVGNG